MQTLGGTRGPARSRTGRAAPRDDPGRRRLLVAGVSALALSGCAVAPDPTPGRRFEPPRVRTGDRWLYRETNQYNRLTLAETEVVVAGTAPLACSVRRLRSETAVGEIERRGEAIEERYSDAWSVVQEPTYDLAMTFASPMPLLPPTLSVGSRRVSQTRFTVSGYSGGYDWYQRLRAVAVERIATPAGTFECLRVRREIRFDYPDPFRHDSYRIDEIWYAAEVNRWVRREWTGDYRHDTSMDPPGFRRREDWVRWELVSYQPAPASAG